jgi:SAM-dependent methyltransferase
MIECLASSLYTLHGAVWLGLLPRTELNEVTARSYSAGSNQESERDEVYNRSGLNGWERAALSEYFGCCRSILVAGAGGGREVVALARDNVRADGFESNRRLAELAAKILGEERSTAAVVCCASDEVPVGLGVYDGGIVGFSVYSHVAGRSNRIRFLRAMGRHLASDGPLLLSFATRGESRQDRFATAIARAIQRARRVEPDAEIGDTLAEMFMHRFTEAEIAAELREGGFELVCFRPQPYAHAIAKSA